MRTKSIRCYVLVGVTGLDHVTISELLGLGTLTSNLARNRDLSTLGTGLHNESKNTVACTADSEATEQLVLEGLGLGLRAEATVSNALSEDLYSTLREVESLLDNGGELANALALLTKDILSAGGLDDDFSADRGNSDLNTGIAILGELAGKKLCIVALQLEYN